MSKELPNGWRCIEMGNTFKIERGGSPRPIEDYITDEANGINWIKIGDTKNVIKYILRTGQKIKPEGLKKTRMVYEGDFILSNSMSFGKPFIMRTTGCIHDGWLVIRKNETINNDFLYYALSSPQVFQQFTQLAKGSTVKNLNIEAVNQVKLWVPDLITQEKIAVQIEELFSELDKGIENLKIAQEQLKVYRQSVLKWAFEGRLTNDNVVDGELPLGWTRQKLNTLTTNHDGKRKPISRLIRANRKGIFRYYGATEIVDYIDDYLFDGEYLLIGEDGANLLSKSKPLAFIVDGKFWVNNHAHVLKAKPNVSNKYICHFFNSLNLANYVTGTAQPKLTQANLNKIEISICSHDEQFRVVEVIESRLSVADKMEETITQSLLQAESLRQSILKKAFEGKLI